jgi:hypothetical protein
MQHPAEDVSWGPPFLRAKVKPPRVGVNQIRGVGPVQEFGVGAVFNASRNVVCDSTTFSGLELFERIYRSLDRNCKAAGQKDRPIRTHQALRCLFMRRTRPSPRWITLRCALYRLLRCRVRPRPESSPTGQAMKMFALMVKSSSQSTSPRINTTSSLGTTL